MHVLDVAHGQMVFAGVKAEGLGGRRLALEDQKSALLDALGQMGRRRGARAKHEDIGRRRGLRLKTY